MFTKHAWCQEQGFYGGIQIVRYKLAALAVLIRSESSTEMEAEKCNIM